MTKREKLLEASREAGFDAAALLPAKEFVFVPEYRKYCEDNLCGNYNHNYSCPPSCGTIEEMKARALRFQNGLVLVHTARTDKYSCEALKRGEQPLFSGAY